MKLIDADALKKSVNDKSTHCLNDWSTIGVLAEVDRQPTIDAVRVVHGKWVEYPRAHYFKCSNCKYTVPYRKANLFNGKREYNYCPHCGAKMDG